MRMNQGNPRLSAWGWNGLAAVAVWMTAAVTGDVTQAAGNTAPIAIIPQPAELSMQAGVFAFTPQTRILVEGEGGEFKALADYASGMLGCPVTCVPAGSGGQDGASASNCIRMGTNAALAGAGPEGYELRVMPGGITIRAAAASGLFYGFQTLRQLLPEKIERPGKNAVTADIPCLIIKDKPRYGWRGFLLDSGYTFWPVETVKRYLDRLAYYKFNVMQWHLTEVRGWRIVINKYPKLTDAANCQLISGKYPREYYTQAELKDIVRYAQERHIRILPEIEAPGHALAALKAYPELTCTGKIMQPGSDGICEDVFCAGNEATYEFLDNVFKEVTAIFPGSMVHIGGDEVVYKHWKACPKCQALMQKEELKDEVALQQYFTRREADLLRKYGRQIVGWDEIADAKEVPEDAVVMLWRRSKIPQPRKVVFARGYQLYLNNQTDILPLRKVYSVGEDTREGNPIWNNPLLLGIQACMWTEGGGIYRTEPVMDRGVFPRLLAVSEAAWSPAAVRNYDDFVSRLQAHLPRLDAMGVAVDREMLLPGALLGEFQMHNVSNETQTLEWDISRYVTGAGTYVVRCIYKGGRGHLSIPHVVLLENQKEVGRREKRGGGDTVNCDQNSFYRISLSQYNTGAVYQVRATIKTTWPSSMTGTVSIIKAEQ